MEPERKAARLFDGTDVIHVPKTTATRSDNGPDAVLDPGTVQERSVEVAGINVSGNDAYETSTLLHGHRCQ